MRPSRLLPCMTTLERHNREYPYWRLTLERLSWPSNCRRQHPGATRERTPFFRRIMPWTSTTIRPHRHYWIGIYITRLRCSLAANFICTHIFLFFPYKHILAHMHPLVKWRLGLLLCTTSVSATTLSAASRPRLSIKLSPNQNTPKTPEYFSTIRIYNQTNSE